MKRRDFPPSFLLRLRLMLHRMDHLGNPPTHPHSSHFHPRMPIYEHAKGLIRKGLPDRFHIRKIEHDVRKLLRTRQHAFRLRT